MPSYYRRPFSASSSDETSPHLDDLNDVQFLSGLASSPTLSPAPTSAEVGSNATSVEFAFDAPTGEGKTSGGGGKSGTGTTTPTTSSGLSTGSSFAPVTVLWNPLTPSTGDAGTPTDDYFGLQWALTSPNAGINVVKAWQNYTGSGVKVGVIDNGIDYKHTDLAANYLSSLDYDTVDRDRDSYYGQSSDYHGTNVAGIIDAARNGSGIVGVAYDAGLATYRIGYSSSAPGSIPDAFSYATKNGMDVINNSYGYSTAFMDNFGTGGPSYIRDAAVLGRNGLGADVVFAAGNYRTYGDDVNYHNYKNNAYVITVAATNYDGKVATWSSPGAALLVSAPGDGVWTDDLTGADGASSGDYNINAGTSFSAPHVAGVVALMLEANPNLGYRDVMEILAYSAKNSDPGSTSWQTNGADDWNGGGLHFSQDYGFGLVDATAAVRLAESWQKQSTYANISSETVVHSDGIRIADGAGSTTSTISFNASLHLEKVVVDLNITHALPSDLLVTLTSPFGTTAVLANHPANGVGGGIVFEMSANTFWGEDAKGTWTLTVSDTVKGNVGTLNGWTLQALGDSPTAPDIYVYTDEFATAPGLNRTVLHDTSGIAGINTAAVSGDSWLDLRPGAVDSVAGRTLLIGSETVLKTAWGGDGNDTIIANDIGNSIQGGRGADVIVAGAGADKLWGGPGPDTFVEKAIGSAADVVGDFAVGSDVLDLRQLFASIGYAGADPVADKWMVISQDSAGTGTNIAVDAHTGVGPQVVVDLLGVSPSSLKQGVDFLTLAGHA